MSVGDNIRLARMNKKLTQENLAELLGIEGCNVGNTTISNWEKGVSSPDPDTIEILCKILNVDANFILGFSALQKVSSPQNEFEVLFDKHKDILTEEDKEHISFIIEQRRKKINEELGEE